MENKQYRCPHCPPRFGYFSYCKNCTKYDKAKDEDINHEEDTCKEDSKYAYYSLYKS